MNTTIKRRGGHSLGIGAALMLMCVSGVEAGPLWSNYTLGFQTTNYQSVLGACTGGPSTCAGVGNSAFTVFDNFTVASQGWVVSGFDYSDFLVDTALNHVQGTTWSLWSGDPLTTTGKLVATGYVPAANIGMQNISGTCGTGYSCLMTFSVSLGANVTLAGGNYYLGTSDNLTSSTDQDYRASVNMDVSTPLPGWENSNGSINGSSWTGPTASNLLNGNSAFDINATLAPEPSTLILMGVAIAGLCLARRRVA